jgi:hypothetical protein
MQKRKLEFKKYISLLLTSPAAKLVFWAINQLNQIKIMASARFRVCQAAN